MMMTSAEAQILRNQRVIMETLGVLLFAPGLTGADSTSKQRVRLTEQIGLTIEALKDAKVLKGELG